MLVSNPLCEKMQMSAVTVPLTGRCSGIALPPRVHVLLLVTNRPSAATFKSKSLPGTEIPAVVGSTTTMSFPVAAGAMLLSAITSSEEHTSELQSQSNLVCRLLLEKKKENSVNAALIQDNIPL